jgi:aspartate/methionine/tyrosine aminotransferase
VAGLPELQELLTAKLREQNGITVGAGNALVVTAGGNMAFNNAILAITDRGDEVIIQVPYYFNHEMAITIAGARPVLVDTDENYQLRPAAIAAAITPRTRAVVTISPNNPTGAVYPERALREVNGLCREHGIYHIHDEAYETFVYEDARHFSPGSSEGSAGHTISLFSFSKTFGFASWRLGYMVIPDALLVSVKKIQDTILICPPVISQYAAIGALASDPGYPHRQLSGLAEVREIMLDALRGIPGCVVPRAAGAFYFLLRLQTTQDPVTLAERLVREHHVAVIPGTAFGVTDACELRVAYGALTRDTAEQGVARLARGLENSLK